MRLSLHAPNDLLSVTPASLGHLDHPNDAFEVLTYIHTPFRIGSKRSRDRSTRPQPHFRPQSDFLRFVCGRPQTSFRSMLTIPFSSCSNEGNASFQSTDCICPDQYPCRPNGPCLPGKLWFTDDHIRNNEPLGTIELVYTMRHAPMDKLGTLLLKGVQPQKKLFNEILGLLCPRDGRIRGEVSSGRVLQRNFR